MPLVFVYGTLKRGQVNYAHWLSDPTQSSFIGLATTVQPFPFFVNSAEWGSSPCVLDAPDDPAHGVRVVGELFEVSDALLSTLHQLEGVEQGVYKVGTVAVQLLGAVRRNECNGDATQLMAAIYFRCGRFPTASWRTECTHLRSGWYDVAWCLRNIKGFEYLAPHLKTPVALRPPFVPAPIALVIIDGAADNAYPLASLQAAYYIELSDRERAIIETRHNNRLTPLEYSSFAAPGLSIIARHGVTGLMDPVCGGLSCGSDTAHLSMFGYDPKVYYRGRGAFESIGAGMSMDAGDIAFKCNFATLDEASGVVLQRRCDRNFTREGPILCEALDGTVLQGPALRFRHTLRVKYATEHRCGVVITGEGLSDQITGTDPLADGRPLLQCAPVAIGGDDDVEAARYTCEVVRIATVTISAVLRAHPINTERRAQGKAVANVVLLRGAASKGHMPSFQQRYGLRGFILAPTCIIRGLGSTCGLDVVDCPGATGDYHSDYAAKARVFSATLFERRPELRYNVGVLHVKGVDDAGHDKSLSMKIKLLINVGTMIAAVWAAAPPAATLAVTADHSTPICIGDHSCEPVPFAVARKSGAERHADAQGHTFGERDAALTGTLGRFQGRDMMSLILRCHFQDHWPALK